MAQRKKLSDMTPMERVEQRMKGLSWDEAEEVGISILARCLALHIYARKEGEEYYKSLMERLYKEADKWAHQGNHATILAFAAVGHKIEKGEIKVTGINK